MENYELSRRLGHGSQGQVYMATHKLTKNLYVLKKIECAEERAANKAFEEAQALNELKHQYVCGYKEFFVTWSKKEQSMNVCIVMDYYKMGDLNGLLGHRRSSKSNIDEIILKKWIGQMVEAIMFVHDKRIIHRDLKPSNIFLTEDLDIRIGDFGVATVMGDERIKTRTMIGSIMWMAPEVLERPYDERSDIWSLGCIILELSTCGFLETNEIHQALIDLKHMPQRLEEILEQVKQEYSADLCHLIRTMLRREFKQRPDSKQLLDIPFVRECLRLCNSVLVKDEHFAAVDPIDKTLGVEGTIDHIRRNQESVSTLIDGLEHLWKLTDDEKNDVSQDGKRLLASVMTKHMKVEAVQLLVLHIFTNAIGIVSEGASDFLLTLECIHPVCLGMRTHAGSVHLQLGASELLSHIATDEDASKLIGQAGGIQDLLTALRAFSENPLIATYCCQALMSLCVLDENNKIVTEERGLLDVRNALEVFYENADLVDAACSALWSMSMDGGNLDLIVDSDVVQHVLRTLALHMKDVRVAKMASMALASVVEVDERCVVQFLEFVDGRSGDTGVQIALKTLDAHIDNEEAVENVTTLCMDLSDYDDATPHLVKWKVVEKLKAVKEKYSSQEVIKSTATVAIGRILGSNKLDKSARPSSARSRPHSAASRPMTGHRR